MREGKCLAAACRAPWESKTVREHELPRCCRCRRRKPAEEFPTYVRKSTGAVCRHHNCRTCQKFARADYRESPEGAAAIKAYNRRPEVMERERERSRRRRLDPARPRYQAEWQKTPRGKLSIARSRARKELREATDPVTATRLTARVAMLDAEIARMDARRRGVAS